MQSLQRNRQHTIGLKAGGSLKIIIAILIFSVLVLFHELGHFLLAKKNGIIVDEFSLGMGPRIISTVKGDTRYSLKLLPFGGSCMMRGEDEDDEGNIEGTFNGAPIWGRISAVAAGPIFNFILVYFIALIVISTIGYDPAKVIAVQEDSPVAQAGLQVGDTITRFKGSRIDIGRDLYNYETLKGVGGGDITIQFLRGGEKQEITYTPYSVDKYMLGLSYPSPSSNDKAVVLAVSISSAFAKAGVQVKDVITAIDGVVIEKSQDLDDYLKANLLDGRELAISYERKEKVKEIKVTPEKTISVQTGFDYNMVREKTSPLGVLKYSAVELKYWIDTTVQSLKMLFNGKVTVNDLSGPVGVVDVIGETFEASKGEGALVTWMSIFNMMMLLSVNLGIMNLLPIPALDGGRLIFLLVEAIRGKPVNRKVEGTIHFVGLMLLLALIVYITFHDIIKLF